MANDPDFNELNSPELSASIASSIRLGIERIRAEQKMDRDPLSDLGAIPPDQETIESYIRAFSILLEILSSDEKSLSSLNSTIEDLSKLCEHLEDHEAEIIKSLITDLEG